ncbi:hypothetical protein Trydic_g18763 [Trypoxylus dichotomus]
MEGIGTGIAEVYESYPHPRKPSKRDIEWTPSEQGIDGNDRAKKYGWPNFQRAWSELARTHDGYENWIHSSETERDWLNELGQFPYPACVQGNSDLECRRFGQSY